MSRTLILTDDAGFLRRCSTTDDIRASCDIIASARPDVVAVDFASPDMTNYPSKIASTIAGEPFKSLLLLCDPLAIVTSELKSRGISTLANVRMNDHHGKLDYWTTWERVDVDGLQLDFGRSAPFVSDPKRQHGTYLTDYLRSVRGILKDRTLGAMVPWDPEFCSDEGLEIEGWVHEGLIDYLSPGEWYYSDWNLPLGYWKDVTRGTSCEFYPFTPGNVSPYQSFEYGMPSILGANHILTGPKIRAIADNFVAQGCDGFALYNFYTFDFGAYYPELREWVDPKQSRGMARHYLTCKRPIYHATELEAYDLGLAFERHELKENCDSAEFDFRFSTELADSSAMIRLATIDSTESDMIRVAVNGTPVEVAETVERPTIHLPSGDRNEMSAHIFEGVVGAPPLVEGNNVLKISLIASDQDRGSSILVGEFELVIDGEDP